MAHKKEAVKGTILVKHFSDAQSRQFNFDQERALDKIKHILHKISGSVVYNQDSVF